MRISGIRAHPVARIVPLDRVARPGAVSRDVMYSNRPLRMMSVACAGTPSSSKESAQPWAVLDAGIANRVDNFGAVPQVVQLVEREKTHVRIVGFCTEHASSSIGCRWIRGPAAELSAVHE